MPDRRSLPAYAVRAEQDGPIVFMAATWQEARDDLTIERGALDLTAYRRSPVLLWSHDYFDRPPIGRTVRLDETDEGLVAEFVFDRADPFAAQVERKVRGKFLNAASIGWSTKVLEGNRVKRGELLDISIVNVPGDADALALARSRYVRSLARRPLPRIIGIAPEEEAAAALAIRARLVGLQADFAVRDAVAAELRRRFA